MKTIALITNIPTPYRIPLFNLLSTFMKSKGWELHVIFSSLGYKRRMFDIDESEFNFKYTVLDGGKYSMGKDAEKTFFFYRGLWKVLHEIKPWRVITSGFSPATLICAIRDFLFHQPFLIWSGTIETEKRKTPWYRKICRKLLLGRASAFICYGTKAATYLKNLGAQPSKIYIAINTVDTEFYRNASSSLKSKGRMHEVFTFVYLGYLVPRKNVKKIIDAVALLHQKRKDFRLVIIGDGISRGGLEENVKQLQLTSLVEFTGYRQKQELPALLAASDALLFQTDFDIWGLVLNEAMAAGIVCMASVNAGASFDLIENGKNGFIHDFKNVADTAKKMEWMMDHREKVMQMGMLASEFIQQKASLKQSAEGFIKALSSTSD